MKNTRGVLYLAAGIGFLFMAVILVFGQETAKDIARALGLVGLVLASLSLLEKGIKAL